MLVASSFARTHPLILLSNALSSISWLTCFNSFSHAILASLYVVFSLMK
uniref:Uncharacterized protein n=1 Tax=Myoviridae sp. ctdv95 TaxID=2825143 RepID=A0A8S5QAS4_9CAUD|nr:MAG TPA: hypothetical protein [Myoviridae sp. ctdv95]